MKINDKLTEHGKLFDGLPGDLTVSNLTFFKYALLTWTDVKVFRGIRIYWLQIEGCLDSKT